MKYEEKNLLTDSIDDQDRTFQITTEPCTEALLRSVKTIGVLNPPAVIEKNSSFIVISGFRRIASCRALKHSEVRARVLPPDTLFSECAQIAIADNSFQRPLNLMELSAAYELLLRGAGDLKLASQRAFDLGIPDSIRIIEKTASLRSLSEPVRQIVITGAVSLATALELLRFSDKEQQLFAALFDTLRLSLNKQKEILTMTEEIAIREDISISDVLSDESIRTVFESQDSDRNQKAKALRTFLRQRRFPHLVKAEAAFQNLIGTLHPEKGIRLIPPPDFEGSEYRISLIFRNPSELEALHAELGRLIRNPGFGRIFSPIKI